MSSGVGAPCRTHPARGFNAPVKIFSLLPRAASHGTRVEQAKGKIKEVAGKATGDTKLETEGKAQKTAGKLQNTIGGMKDAVKEALDD